LVIDLECGQAAARSLEGQAKPQARVTRRRSDLNDTLAGNCLREQPQRLSIFGGNTEVCLVRLHHLIEDCEDSPLLLGFRQGRIRSRRLAYSASLKGDRRD